MPEWWSSTVGPAAPIIGALLSAIIGGVITLVFIHKRKQLTFTMGKSEDLTSPLKQHHGLISFKFGLREVSNLNRATVRVKNSGNTTLKDVKFDVMIYGSHPFHISEVSMRDANLLGAIKTDWGIDGSSNPKLSVSVDFLNPKETFELLMYYDGEPEQPTVYCRMEEVRVKLKTGEVAEGLGEVAGALLQGLIPINIKIR